MARPAASRCRQSLRSAALASLCMLVGYGMPAFAEPVVLERSNGPNIVLAEGPGMTDAAQDLYLEVILNQVHTRRVMHVAVDAQNRLYAWPQNLREIGLHLAGWPQDR
jgi:hypothetical protein